jgi:hypothetical protein
MAKITAYIPEPTPEYSPDNQRQVLQSLRDNKEPIKLFFSRRFKTRN